MNVLLAHPGTQYSHQLARQLEQHGLLAAFHTGLAVAADGLAGRACDWLPPRLRRRVANRRIEGVPAARLRLYPECELKALFHLREVGKDETIIHERNQRFQEAIPQGDLASADVVVGFDTSSWILAERCEKVGVPLVLDQSIAHPDSKIGIYARVRAAYPDWSGDVQPRLPAVRVAEQIEHERARLIVAASTFTQRSLLEHGVPAARIQINPYGVDSAQFTAKPAPSSGPLRFVFVGAVTARKGVPLLLEVWEQLRPRDAELWIVGPVADSVRRLLPDQPGLRVLGSVPHREVAGLLRQCDVFVFPSYFEGFGLVILEAMACGLPVITTTATAGPDVDPACEASWIMEPGDKDTLLAVMDRCLSRPAAARERGKAARCLAERNSWAAYGKRWVDILTGLRN